MVTFQVYVGNQKCSESLSYLNTTSKYRLHCDYIEGCSVKVQSIWKNRLTLCEVQVRIRWYLIIGGNFVIQANVNSITRRTHNITLKDYNSKKPWQNPIMTKQYHDNMKTRYHDNTTPWQYITMTARQPVSMTTTCYHKNYTGYHDNYTGFHDNNMLP